MKRIVFMLYIIRAVKIAMVLTIIIAMVSCSKESQEISVPAAPAAVPVKKWMEWKNTSDPSDFRKFTYNAQNKLIKVESSFNVWSLEYQPSKVISTKLDKASNKVVVTQEYFLDATGKTTMIDGIAANGLVTSSEYFSYDAEGYLINSRIVYSNGSTYEAKFTIAGGNLIKEEAFSDGALQDKTDYFYDVQVKNKISSSMAVVTWGIKGLFGKDYTNESNGFKRYDPSGALIGEKKSSFELDADGYVIKKTDFMPISGQTRVYEFVYQ